MIRVVPTRSICPDRIGDGLATRESDFKNGRFKNGDKAKYDY